MTCHDTSQISHITTFSSFFILGFLTSFHCVGMCGPISTLFISQKSTAILESLKYNFSRLISYIFVGSSLYYFGAHLLSDRVKYYSAVALIALIVFNSVFRVFQMPVSVKKYIFLVQKKILIIVPKNFKSIIIGLFSGVFPCGLLYTAYAASLTAVDLSHAIVSLVFFAIGTMPALFTFHVIGIKLIKLQSSTVQKYIYLSLASVSVIFIFVMNFIFKSH